MTEPIESTPPRTAEPALGHSYDGIQEYDNPLPGWWTQLFIATILFAPIYWIVFQSGGPGSTMEEKYQLAKDLNTKKQYAEIGDLDFSEGTLVDYLRDPKKEKWIGVGGSIFKANCVSCHGADGGGNVGPNLCDEHYKHIKSLPDIVKVVSEGVGAGAMPAWGARLGHKNDLVLVSVYVASLRGSKPAKGKAPDGSPIAPWPNP